jgi:hypothetical protein
VLGAQPPAEPLTTVPIEATVCRAGVTRRPLTWTSFADKDLWR